MSPSTFQAEQARYRAREAAEWSKLLGEMQTGGAPNFMVRQVELSIDRIKTKPLRTICGAKTRKGQPCRAKSEPNRRRCRFHGGLSTGPKTPEGKARALAVMMAGHKRWRASNRARAMGCDANQNQKDSTHGG